MSLRSSPQDPGVQLRKLGWPSQLYPISRDVTFPSPVGTSLLETRDHTACILGSAVTAFQAWVRFPMPQSEWRGLKNPWTPSLESFMEEGFFHETTAWFLPLYTTSLPGLTS